MSDNSVKSELYSLFMLTNRNLKLFLKDKAGVFFSLMAPLIVMLLYVLFLGDIQVSTVKAYFPEAVPIDENAIKAFVDSWMVAGVISVACITVSFGANTIMVQDKTRGVINDALSSPIKRRVITFSYFLYNFAVTVVIVVIVTLVCFVYIAASGSWYLSAADVFAILGTVLYASLSSTLITVFVCSFFNSEGAMSAFTGVVSAVLGFLIGAYMPLSIMPEAAQYISAMFPGSHAAGLFRNFLMQGALDNLGGILPPQAIEGIAGAFTMDVNFFGKEIGTDIMSVYVGVFIILFLIINLIAASAKNSIYLTTSAKGKFKKKAKKTI